MHYLPFQIAALLATCALGITAQAEPVFDEDGPFRPGEGFGTPATCETMPDWIDRAPDYDGRISMVIEGAIVESHWDGALAYLTMCEPDEVQVMCVTYYQEEVTGEPVQFAGGYNRAGERQIVLDPCLTYPVDGAPAERETQ
jgi:hypothetical protein